MSKEQTVTDIAKYESGLEPDKHNALAKTYNQVVGNMTELLEAGRTVEVKDATDVEGMKKAREIRLQLRKIRAGVENTRKALKESALREGKAIDGMANILKFVIEPVEEELQKKEDFVKLAEEKRKQELAEEREGILKLLDVDCTHFDLANMHAEAFESLRQSSEAGHKAKLEAEAAEKRRQEEAKIAAAKAELERQEALEKERLAREEAMRKAEEERAKLQAEKDALEKKMEAERKERQAKEAELQRKYDEEKAAKEAQAARALAIQQEEAARMKREKEAAEAKAEAERQAELQRIADEKAAKEAALAAPDKKKIEMFRDEILELQIPEVRGDIAIQALSTTARALNKIISDLSDAIAALEEQKQG